MWPQKCLLSNSSTKTIVTPNLACRLRQNVGWCLPKFFKKLGFHLFAEISKKREGDKNTPPMQSKINAVVFMGFFFSYLLLEEKETTTVIRKWFCTVSKALLYHGLLKITQIY